MMLQKRFHTFLQESKCLPVGARLLVAVSGGADSVALLHLLRQVSEKMRFDLVVAHLDHCLRAGSGGDAAFVKRLCDELELPFVGWRRDVAKIAQERKGNLEETGREVRRKFFAKVAADQSCDAIVLGQHADDQAETFLMRLLRGAGSTGLAGMKVNVGQTVRPLLNFHRQELVDFLEENGLEWREDASNADLRFTRNRIRHELLPLMATFNPKINAQLSDLCARLNQDEDVWSGLAVSELERISQPVKGGLALDRGGLSGMQPALSRRIIRQALSEVRGELRGLSAVHLGDVQTLVDHGPVQGELDLPGAWVGRRYGQLLILENKPSVPEFFEVFVEKVGRYVLPGGQNLVLTLENSVSGEHPGAVEFAADDISFPLTIRHCKDGDRIRPLGMSGSKKLQDLFVDQKIPREERNNTLLLLQRDEVLWIVGVRRCEGYRPTSSCRVLRATIEAR